MTEADLTAIRARLAAITPGPWVARCRDISGKDSVSGLGWEIDGPPEPDLRGQFARGADAKFIAAAPADVAALLAEVTRVRALIEKIYPLTHDEMCRLRAEWRLPMEERECTCYISRDNVILAQALGDEDAAGPPAEPADDGVTSLYEQGDGPRH